MKIGFNFKFPIESLIPGRGKNFLGDEMTANSLRRELLRFPEVEYCELFNGSPKEKLDIIVYWHDNPPNKKWAKRSIFYFQNGYPQGSDKKLFELYKNNHDGFMFISKPLYLLHRGLGYSGAYIPTATDEKYFKPMRPVKKYMFDVIYVGNDIKGVERTMKYIYPAIKFKFGLFGNWNTRFWWTRHYRRLFKKISKGQISFEDLPLLYNSAKIVLNCTLQDNVNWNVITGRTYDVMACNAFLITDVVPSAVSKLDGNVIFTSGGLDLEKKIRYYLKHEDERKKIAARGRKKILKADTFKHRARLMLEYFKEIL